MSKSIFEPSASESLSNIFSNMTASASRPPQQQQQPQVVTESKRLFRRANSKLLKEGFEEEIPTDEVYGSEGDIEDDLDLIDDEEGDLGEVGEMVEVPRDLLDQLISYLEDPMADEDTVVVDDSDFEIPEEKIQYSTLKSLFGDTTSSGSGKQSNKTTPSSTGGVHIGADKVRTGKAELLKALKQCSAKVNTKWSVGQSWVKK